MPAKRDAAWWRAYREKKKKEEGSEADVLELQQETVAKIGNATPVATVAQPLATPVATVAQPQCNPLQPQDATYATPAQHTVITTKKLHNPLQPLIATQVQHLVNLQHL